MSGLSVDEQFALEDAIECFVTDKAGATDFEEERLVTAHEQSTIGEFIQYLNIDENKSHVNIFGAIQSALTDSSIPHDETVDVNTAFNKIMPDFILAYRKIDKQTPAKEIKLFKLKGYIMTSGTKIP